MKISQFAIIVFRKLTSCFKTKNLLPDIMDEIKFVLTVSRRKNMPACYIRHTISNGTRGSRFRVHVNVTLNLQTEHDKPFISSKVVNCSSI